MKCTPSMIPRSHLASPGIDYRIRNSLGRILLLLQLCPQPLQWSTVIVAQAAQVDSVDQKSQLHGEVGVSIVADNLCLINRRPLVHVEPCASVLWKARQLVVGDASRGEPKTHVLVGGIAPGREDAWALAGQMDEALKVLSAVDYCPHLSDVIESGEVVYAETVCVDD